MDSAAGVRQATMASQIIHTRLRTQASTMAIDTAGEKPSTPTSQPCARYARPVSAIRTVIGREIQTTRATAAATRSKARPSA
jgi:hypothetical protein